MTVRVHRECEYKCVCVCVCVCVITSESAAITFGGRAAATFVGRNLVCVCVCVWDRSARLRVMYW